MECEKCGSSLTCYKGIYKDYYYCATCFYHFGKEYNGCCRDSKKIYVKLGSQLRTQCINCGNMSGGALKYSLVPDFHSLPLADEVKRDAYYESSHKEYKRFKDWAYRQKYNSQIQEYSSYLQSEEWSNLRHKVLNRDNFVCQSCLIKKATQVHHLTYERIYSECAFDLVSICEECHGKIHGK